MMDQRKFINDFDTVIMRAHCKNDNIRIGFGECIGQIIPAK
jgi:fumarylacetoacetase